MINVRSLFQGRTEEFNSVFSVYLFHFILRVHLDEKLGVEDQRSCKLLQFLHELREILISAYCFSINFIEKSPKHRNAFCEQLQLVSQIIALSKNGKQLIQALYFNF